MHTNPSRTACHYSFPPLFTVEQLVNFSIKNSHQGDPQQTISSWRMALATSNESFYAVSKYASSRSEFVNLSRAYAAAIVLSLILSFGLFIAFVVFLPLVMDVESYPEFQQTGSGEAILVEKKKRRWTPLGKLIIGLGILDVGVLLAAFLCFGAAMDSGPASLSRLSAGDPSGGKLFLVFAMLLRVISVPILGAVLLVVGVFLAIALGIALYYCMICVFSMLDN